MKNENRIPITAFITAILVIAAAAAGGNPKDLLLPKKSKPINLTHTMTDSDNHRWDISYYGTVGSGDSSTYGGGMYLQINGSQFRASSQGKSNAAGDEIELGPWQSGSMRVHRRIKVYKDRPLARWLDIIENTSSTSATVSAGFIINTNWTIDRKAFSSGKAAWSEKDWAFVTRASSGRNNLAMMHLVCGKRAKTKPTITISSASIKYNYSLTIPAKTTVILCHFESQGDFADHVTRMKKFKPYDALRDLSASMRKLIVNFPTTSGFGNITLDRHDKYDTIFKSSDSTPVYGKILNKSFDIESRFGKFTLPISRVLGMVRSRDEADGMFVLLTDGQVVGARLPGQKISIELPTGGVLNFPMSAISQIAFQIMASKPNEIPFPGSSLIFRSGDRVKFDPASVDLPFETRHGGFNISSDSVRVLDLSIAQSGVHRVMFKNGSMLAGLFAAERISPKLTLTSQPYSLRRNDIRQIVFNQDELDNNELTGVVLNNSDEVFGQMANKQLMLTTEFGLLTIWPHNIQKISFSPTIPGRVAIVLWNGSTLRGRLSGDEFGFSIIPGPGISIAVGQCQSIKRSHAMSANNLNDELAKLINQLGSPKYAIRTRASRALLQRGKGIVPALRKKLTNITNPEVKQSIETLLQKLDPEGKTPANKNQHRAIPMPNPWGPCGMAGWGRG